MFLTILTPAYNRQEGIKTLYQSLAKQTADGFEWLVVDDGSSDNTQGVVEELKKQSPFPIRYVYKENGGKHTALNVGVAKIDTPLTFIVDSDDYLTEDAVESIKGIYDKYGTDENLCGYVFLRMFPDGKINGKTFCKNELIASYIDFRINGDDTNSDKAEVFFTKCLKEFPFPEYPNEKFLGEDLVWIQMARKYKMVHINKPIYIGSYLNDGLTNNRRKHNIQSPIGCMNRAKEFMERDIKFKYRIKGGMQYIIYGKFANLSIRQLLNNQRYKFLTFFCILPAMMIYWKWRKRVNN